MQYLIYISVLEEDTLAVNLKIFFFFHLVLMGTVVAIVIYVDYIILDFIIFFKIIV